MEEIDRHEGNRRELATSNSLKLALEIEKGNQFLQPTPSYREELELESIDRPILGVKLGETRRSTRKSVDNLPPHRQLAQRKESN